MYGFACTIIGDRYTFTFKNTTGHRSTVYCLHALFVNFDKLNSKELKQL